MNSQLQNFQLYNKSLKEWSLGESVNFVSFASQRFPRFRLGKHSDSRETILTVSPFFPVSPPFISVY